tara:strand:- start:742 stop:1113 length:372 start_codon:yes stop_codon:yes gene_type:complete
MSNWKRKKNYNGKNKNYSVVNKLRRERKTTDELEIMMNNLTLEEVIALKLELTSRSLSNRLYGFPIWKALTDITKEAALKYAVSATRTTKEAMRLLGLKESSFHVLMKKYQVEDYFENLDNNA